MRPIFIKWIITLTAVLIAVCHAYFPDIKIDSIILTLLAIALIPWLAPLFRSVELPGGVKVEFQELETAKKKVEEAGLLSADGENNKQKAHVYAFESVAGNDPNLALAGLRIEIESRLREIAKNKNINDDRAPLRIVTSELVKKGVLNRNEATSIEELLPLLNSAAHGASVDSRATEWALEFGPRLLDALEDRLGETTVPKLVSQWKDRDGAGVAEIGAELSKALVRSPKAFMQVMKNDSESYDSWLDGIDHHTFTIYESRGEVEDDLYEAYYEKLKQLMSDSVKPLLNGEFKIEAKKLLDVLETVKVSRIW